MIDVSSKRWNLSKDETAAIYWLEQNGFDGKIEKQYVSKTVFSVTKDGITDKFELPQGIAFKSISDYMKLYGKSFEMLTRLKRGGSHD